MSKKKEGKLWPLLEKFFGPDYTHIPKYIAFVGMTRIIKQLIEETDDIKLKVSQLGREVDKWLPLFPWETRVPIEAASPEDIAKALDMPIAEVWQWLSAFTFAYLIVEHFDAIMVMMGQAAGGLSSAVRMLAGL